jgi:hypothetical protein
MFMRCGRAGRRTIFGLRPPENNSRESNKILRVSSLNKLTEKLQARQ